ncbi:hypothetical protein ACFLUJ_05775 [Chloroflexota bacterium]
MFEIRKIKPITQKVEDEERQPVNFWQGKTPCWEMCHCPASIKSQCPAHRNPSLPCWEIQGTYLKLSDDINNGNDISICRICRVYKRYGKGKPIEIRLFDKGLDFYCRTLKEKCQSDEFSS